MRHRDHDRRHVAWDIETTGFARDDRLTVAWFWLPDGRAKLLVNAGDHADGDLRAVCRHNLADVHRTWELGELVREYVPAADRSERKLCGESRP